MAKRKNRRNTIRQSRRDTGRTKANRKYKDTVFRLLFSDKENLLSLYNAISGKSYADPEQLEIVTLENAVYMGMKNDLAFIIDTDLFLYEHQSTYTPNMPLRDLFYISAEYQRVVDRKSLYSSVQQKIPAPSFIVFYNGKAEKPDCWVNYLSDAYQNRPDEPNLELKVVTLNISEGHNESLMEQCRTLKEYAQYVSKVRDYTEEMGLDAAVERAVDECIREGILEEFLRKNRAEVVAMSIFEYDKEDEERKLRAAEYEAGREEGLEAGRKAGLEAGRKAGLAAGRREGLESGRLVGIKEIIHSLNESGMEQEQIAYMTKLDIEQVRNWLLERE